MALSTKVLKNQILFPGLRIIRGSIKFDSTYASGGETLDLSSYFVASSSPTVLLDGGGLYAARHNQGTASAGKVQLFRPNSNVLNGDATSANTTLQLVQCDVNTDASSVNCGFIAFGESY